MESRSTFDSGNQLGFILEGMVAVQTMVVGVQSRRPIPNLSTAPERAGLEVAWYCPSRANSDVAVAGRAVDKGTLASRHPEVRRQHCDSHGLHTRLKIAARRRVVISPMNDELEG